MIKIDRPTCPNASALSGGNYKHRSNKAALMAASSDKCMYCESKVSHVYFADIEHIKPRSEFPELEFSWDNLGYVCAQCNGTKSNKYDEETPYLNPYIEDPDLHIFALGVIMKQKRGSERGDLTISDIGLNRQELLEKRKTKIERIQRAVDACFRTSNAVLRDNALEELKREADKDKEYSLCIRYLLKGHEII